MMESLNIQVVLMEDKKTKQASCEQMPLPPPPYIFTFFSPQEELRCVSKRGERGGSFWGFVCTDGTFPPCQRQPPLVKLETKSMAEMGGAKTFFSSPSATKFVCSHSYDVAAQ